MSQTIPSLEQVGEGVEVLRVRMPLRPRKVTNIYFLEDEGGVVVYESGSVADAEVIRRVAEDRGGITRIVISHAHADHRGGASKLDAPIWCHSDERPGAEGDGWVRDGYDLSKIRDPVVRAMTPRALRDLDGGPVKIGGTLSEGDDVAGFRVIHLPGHTPGLIGLWHKRDRLAIVSDAVFVWNPFTIAGMPGKVRLPPAVVRPDDAAARASLRKIADLDPAAVWLGHYGPITDNAAATLRCVAEGP